MEGLLHTYQEVINCKTFGLDFLLGQTLQGTYHLSSQVSPLIFVSNEHQIIFIPELKNWEKQLKLMTSVNPNMLVDKGLVLLENYNTRDNQCLIGYYVLPNNQRTLEEEKIDVVQSLDIISELIELVRKVHKAGYIMNDFSLKNIAIDSYDRVNFFNFLACSKFPKNGSSSKPTKSQPIDTLFASVNLMELKTTSRRDDLQQICYLLLYLINGRILPGIDISNLPDNKKFIQLLQFKKLKTFKNMLNSVNTPIIRKS